MIRRQGLVGLSPGVYSLSLWYVPRPPFPCVCVRERRQQGAGVIEMEVRVCGGGLTVWSGSAPSLLMEADGFL